MIYGSVCSGIEAATVAWHPMSWRPAFFSEIENFQRGVLSHHYPHVPLHGDFTTIGENTYNAIDLLVGGTPCQSFSVAGLRKGYADERGNLTLEFIRLAERLRPKWILWENVPGALSNDAGRAFGSFLGGLAKCGYGFAYRVLDAQYFGVPQRRQRIFVVGYFGDWRPPAAVLFEQETLRGDIASRRRKKMRFADRVDKDFEVLPISTMVARRKATDNRQGMGIGSGGDPQFTITKNHCHAIAIQGNLIGRGVNSGPQGAGVSDVMYTLTKCDTHAVSFDGVVRYMTPLECERAQGFPDNYTLIPWDGKTGHAPDTLRYEAIGNSMAVPVMAWLGQRIQMVNDIIEGGGNPDGLLR